MKANRMLVWLGLVAVGCALWGGCEWEATPGTSSWGNRPGLVNANGVYRPRGAGGYVVTTRGVYGTEAPLVARSYDIGTGDGATLVYGGTIPEQPLQGTVTVTDGFEIFTDSDVTTTNEQTLTQHGDLIGSRGGVGSVNYATGVILVEFANPVDSGANVQVGYAPVTDTADQGSTYPITRVQIWQQGDLVELVDNNGDTFIGRLGVPIPSFDEFGTNAISAPTYPFQATGTSKGLPVQIDAVITVETIIYYFTDVAEGGEAQVEIQEVARLHAFVLRGTWYEPTTGQSGLIDGIGPADKVIENFLNL